MHMDTNFPLEEQTYDDVVDGPGVTECLLTGVTVCPSGVLVSLDDSSTDIW